MKTIRYIVPILIFVAGGCKQGREAEPLSSDICIDNLRTIEMAEQVWELKEHKTTNDVPVMADLTNYTKQVLVCPEGGTYTIGPVWKGPTCSIKGHEIPR